MEAGAVLTEAVAAQDSGLRSAALPPPEAPAYERVAAVLRDAMGAGRLRPGTVLREGEVAALLRAGRSPVRQALARLLAEGRVRRHEGRGVVVGDAAPVGARLDAATLVLPEDGGTLGRTLGWRRVYDAVERDLVFRSVLGRFRINEVELARHYGIGRSVAAQVLLRAEALGLLRKAETGHWVIVPLDQERLANLYALRMLLEGAAVAEAAQHMPEDAMLRMALRLDAARAAYPAVDAAGLDALEHDLHVDALGWAPNPELLDVLARTRCVILSSKHLLGSGSTPPADDPFLEEHAAVVAALGRRDGVGAKRAMVAHLRSAQTKVAARLDRFRTQFEAPALPYVVGPLEG